MSATPPHVISQYRREARGPQIKFVDPLDFTLLRRKTGRKRKLAPWQVSIVRRATKLRRRLTNKALAARFGVHAGTIEDYAQGRHKDW